MHLRQISTWLLTGVLFIGLGQAAAADRIGNPPPAAPRKVIVTSPQAYQLVHSPLTVTGRAKGAWFFEGTFPIKLLDGHGQEITTWVPVHAKADWMSTGWVPFEATLEFKEPATATGTLLLQNDNPSGLPENREEFRLPVRFK